MGIFKLQKDSVGYDGENIAEGFLKKAGYKIIERNWCNKKGRRIGEIDIIAKDKKTDYLVFVEVKTRKISGNDEILPGLLSITNDIEKKPKIRYFEGKEGIREIYKDTLRYHNQETLVWTTEDVLEYFDVQWLWDYYVVKRVENKIWQRTIAPDIEYAKELGGLDKKHLRDMRFCSKEQFPMYVDVTLYGGRYVGIMSFKDGLGLIIESEGIYKTLKSIFEMNWLMLENYNKTQ